MPKRPRLLLFDLDDVLVSYRRDRRCEALAQAIGAEPRQVRQALFGSGLETRCDRGELDLPDYLDALRSEHGLIVPEDAFIAARAASMQARPAMLQLCRALADQAALAIFTNNGRWLGRQFNRLAPELAPLFRFRVVCSGSLGHCKPHPLAYLGCLQQLGVPASATFFTDDLAEHVAGAASLGIDSELFTSPAALALSLAARGFDLDPVTLN